MKFMGKSTLIIKSSRLEVSDLRNYFTIMYGINQKEFKPIISCSKWIDPYNCKRYETIITSSLKLGVYI